MMPKPLSPTGEESPSLQPLPVLPYLPDELILKILLRVSVRSLLRFKCVSKSWNSVISDPQFAKDHLRISIAERNMTHQRLISSIGDCKIESLSLQSLLQNPSTLDKPRCFTMNGLFRTLGTCNGLLCLLNIRQFYVTLWNPFIGFASKRFPTRLSPYSYSREIIFYGFGYDHVNDNYKLLLAMETGFRSNVTKIYTFGANSCSKVIQSLPSHLHPNQLLGKFLSDTLNWAVAEQGVSDKKWVILSFDFGTETCGEVLLPRDSDNVCSPVLDVARNCLCVCFYDSKKSHWAVWLMKEYGVQDSWTQLMIIPRFVEEGNWPWKNITHHDELRACRCCPSLHPLCILENGIAVFKTTSSQLVVYNSKYGRLNYARIRGDFRSYHESLISPP